MRRVVLVAFSCLMLLFLLVSVLLNLSVVLHAKLMLAAIVGTAIMLIVWCTYVQASPQKSVAENSMKKEEFPVDLKEEVEEIMPALEEQLAPYKNGLSHIHKETKGYSAILHALLQSIIDNISVTTTPISEELLSVREESALFLRNMHKFYDEIVNKTTLSHLNSGNDTLKNDIESLSDNIRDTFASFNKNLDNLESILTHIFSISAEIENIAQKINILSINAAIESARAGESGKGFKVISDEIKKLSGHTESFVKEISTTINESKRIFTVINQEFETKESSIRTRITAQNSDYETFFELFSKQFKDFEEVYSGVNEFIEKLSVTVTKISPVVQLHEITVQEMGNFDLVLAHFVQHLLEKSAENADGSLSLAEMEKIVFKIREDLTTSRELDAVQNGLQESGFSEKIDLKRNNQDIEFF